MTKRAKLIQKRLRNINPSICSQRCRIYTDAYVSTKNEVEPIRQAIALSEVLRKMDIYIGQEELIVGNIASRPCAAPIFPEYGMQWIIKELDTIASREADPYYLAEEDKEVLKECFKYWQNKSLSDKVDVILPEEAREAEQTTAVIQAMIKNGAPGHLIPDYETILSKGLNGLIAEAEDHLDGLELWKMEDYKKRDFLKAMIIAGKAILNFAKRYAVLAKKRQNEEIDFVRKSELGKIAGVCERVPASPARNFWEVLQTLVFINFAMQIEGNGLSYSLGRVDQYLWPYYQRDIQEGRIDYNKARELLECFVLKFFEIQKVFEEKGSNYWRGYQTYINLTLGGQTQKREDATNELSYLLLDILSDLRLPKPLFSVRIHSGTPEKFLKKACEVNIKYQGGQPSFVNDEVAIPTLVASQPQVTERDALNWAVVGCVELAIPGWGFVPNAYATYFSLLKILEMALYDGRDPNTRYQLCKGNGDLATWNSFEDVLKAWQIQVNYYAKIFAIYNNIFAKLSNDYLPLPFCSLVSKNCIKEGRSLFDGGGLLKGAAAILIGPSNVGNCLAAIKKFVFEERKLTGKQLKHALETNFEDNSTTPTGKEIRQMLLNKVPKFGNDEDYVDLLVRETLNIVTAEFKKYRTPDGVPLCSNIIPVAAHMPFGEAIGATPDGRKAGEPTADTCAPSQGTDVKGPTAVIKSVSKIDHTQHSGGTVLNLKLNPDGMEKKVDIFATLIRTYFELKGYQIQVNILSNKTLKEAQRHPELYRNLLVRVAGYSAYFVDLDKKVQDDIIARTTHEFDS